MTRVGVEGSEVIGCEAIEGELDFLDDEFVLDVVFESPFCTASVTNSASGALAAFFLAIRRLENLVLGPTWWAAFKCCRTEHLHLE